MKNNKNFVSSKIIIIIGIALVVFFAIKLLNTKHIKLTVGGYDVKCTYSNFKYKKKNENQNEVKIESKNEEVIFKTYDNNGTDYNSLKEYKKMVYKGEEKQFKKNTFLCYKNETDNSFCFMIKISDNSYAEILVSNKDNRNLDEIPNNKDIKKILNSLKISN